MKNSTNIVYGEAPKKPLAIRVIEIADAEAASLILAHGTFPRMISCYLHTSIFRGKNYTMHKRKCGESIRPLLELSSPAFEPPSKNYIGRGRARRDPKRIQVRTLCLQDRRQAGRFCDDSLSPC